jgi:ferredoxin
MKAIVDEGICASCGVCAEVCPEVFEMNDEDIAAVKVDPIPAELEESCRDAADQCPCDAIAVED